MQITHSNGHQLKEELEYWSIEELISKYNFLVSGSAEEITSFIWDMDNVILDYDYIEESRVFHNHDMAHNYLRVVIYETLAELMEDHVEDWVNQRSFDWKVGTSL